jgi:hypothetical protein
MTLTLDSKVLAALHLMSRDTTTGVKYIEFVKQDIMGGALYLIDREYATKIKTGGDEDDENYCLTPKGLEYLGKLLRFATEQL